MNATLAPMAHIKNAKWHNSKKAQIDSMMVSFNHGRKWPTARFLLQCHNYIYIPVCCGCSQSVRCNLRSNWHCIRMQRASCIVRLRMKISSWKWISNIKCVISPSLPSPRRMCSMLNAHHTWPVTIQMRCDRRSEERSTLAHPPTAKQSLDWNGNKLQLSFAHK